MTPGADYGPVLEVQGDPTRIMELDFSSNSLLELVENYCPGINSLGLPIVAAGGFIRDCIINVRPRDLDLYIYDVSARFRVEDYLIASKWKLLRSAPWVRTWIQCDGRSIDIVFSDFQDIRELLCKFDLTVCAVGIDLQSGRLFAVDTFLDDLHRRRLVLLNPAIPSDTMNRIGKFVDRGFSFDELQVAALGLLMESAEGK